VLADYIGPNKIMWATDYPHSDGFFPGAPDAKETARWVEQAGRKAVVMAGDVADPAHCRALVARAVKEFGRLDVLVNNAAYQMTFQSLDEISEQEWDKTFRTNIYSMFYLTKAARRRI